VPAEAGGGGPAALPSSSLPRSELGLGLAGNQGQVVTDIENVWPKPRMKRPVRWLFAETPVQSKLFPHLLGLPAWVPPNNDLSEVEAPKTDNLFCLIL